MNATTSIILDTRRAKKDGTYPVKLRITYNREREYYPTNYALTSEAFEATQNPKARGDNKILALKFQAFEKRAADIIEDLDESFTFSNFENLFVQNRALKGTVEGAFDDYIDSLEPERIGTIETYNRAKVAFAKYKPKAKIGDVSVKFLNGFEAWMKEKGNSITTTGIYCRSLRSVLNILIDDGKMSKASYPFGSSQKRKYEIPTSKNKKKAMVPNDISKIYHYPCEPDSNAEMCRDYWMFLYMGNGLNVADFCRLKWKNITGDRISFLREKTIRTKKEVEEIQIVIQPEMKTVIDKWGTSPLNKEMYIFPHISASMTHEEAYKTVKKLTWLINKHLKSIAKEVGLDQKVTTYYARHSFATILKNSGAPVAMISQALGHSSLTTTQNYLAGFETDQLRDATSVLMKFEKESK